ncbi:hypothetical protein BKA62DRAFT_672904 [Auriculariales sp. MPI-PUGE-AT-0066]|nr:hypothetical protein BKA62DRAFT_672904 [Auriculariales sp. MPI-PUGE-AT-0066]
MNTVSVPASLDSAPGDIFSEIMCYIDGTTLANWTRVSKRWGDLILDHPVYWGQLELTEVSDGSSALFLKRMSHSRGRTITVLVMTRQYDDPSRSIFSAIGENMGHISSLTLICPLSQPIFELIAQPAPLLHTLHLKSTTGLVFPKPETFQFSAPRLRIVNLINIAAPPGPVAALSNTQSLTCGLSRSYRWWSNGSVFRWAQAATPQLQSLAVFMFNASASALSDDNWEALEGWLAQLSKLTIEVDTPFVAAPQLFLPRMSCIQSPISTVAISAVVTHLHEAEWLSVSATAERAEVACACRRRSVAFGPGPSGPSKSSVGISFFIGSKLADPTLPTAPSGRISSIELALDIWNDLALTHSRGQALSTALSAF